MNGIAYTMQNRITQGNANKNIHPLLFFVDIFYTSFQKNSVALTFISATLDC